LRSLCSPEDGVASVVERGREMALLLYGKESDREMALLLFRKERGREMALLLFSKEVTERWLCYCLGRKEAER
jgi:hypothetical protein